MKYLLALILAVSTLPLTAQWTSNTQINTEVKDSIGFEESVPLSATTSDGKTFVSYFAQYNGGYQMRLQLLDSAGYKLFGPAGLLVSNFPQSTALFRYDLKLDSEDNAVVAFQDIRTGGALNIVAYKIDPLGNFIWGNNGIQLIDPVSTEGLGPNIGFTNAGNVIISWNASSANASWVAVEKLSPGGTLMWTNTLRVIDSTFTKRYTRPSTVPVGADDFSMLYVEQTGFGLGVSNMYAQRYDSNGNSFWISPIHISTKTISFFYFCKAISDDQGGFFVGFSTSDANFPALSDVYVQHVDSSGNLWNATGNIACNVPNIQRYCNATRFSSTNNTFWVLMKVTDVNQNQSGVTVQSFDITGNVLLTPAAVPLRPISSTYDDPSDFAITSDGIIAFYITGNLPNQTINAIKSDFFGNLQWNGFQANICTNSSGKDDLAAGLFVNNQVVAVWTDYRNDYGVYAQNIRNDGQMGPLTSIQSVSGEANGIFVYPNPFENTINLKLNNIDSGVINLKLTDISGRIIWQNQMETNENVISNLTLQAINSGVYFLEIRSSGSASVLKMIRK
ncbi:MAG TPA: T9SS type A sorting domain-containing protein [Bacteroidia bacterium]|nr:T9SS type A sorting domain-containing protein [Bacteroidia bacterium]